MNTRASYLAGLSFFERAENVVLRGAPRRWALVVEEHVHGGRGMRPASFMSPIAARHSAGHEPGSSMSLAGA